MEKSELRLDIATSISNARNLYQLDVDVITAYLDAYERTNKRLSAYTDNLINSLNGFKNGFISDYNEQRPLLLKLIIFFINCELVDDEKKEYIPDSCLYDLLDEIKELDDQDIVNECLAKIARLQEDVSECYDSLGIKAVQYDSIKLENQSHTNDRQYDVYGKIDSLNYQINFYELKTDKIIKRKNQLRSQLEGLTFEERKNLSIATLQNVRELVRSNKITLK